MFTALIAVGSIVVGYLLSEFTGWQQRKRDDTSSLREAYARWVASMDKWLRLEKDYVDLLLVAPSADHSDEYGDVLDAELDMRAAAYGALWLEKDADMRGLVEWFARDTFDVDDPSDTTRLEKSRGGIGARRVALMRQTEALTERFQEGGKAWRKKLPEWDASKLHKLPPLDDRIGLPAPGAKKALKP